MNIEPCILIKSRANGLNFYHYLHIRGGAGDTGKGKHRNGGEYYYILYYASPDQLVGINGRCERIWCEETGIPYGEGNSIELAYENWLTKTDKHRL